MFVIFRFPFHHFSSAGDKHAGQLSGGIGAVQEHLYHRVGPGRHLQAEPPRAARAARAALRQWHHADHLRGG